MAEGLGGLAGQLHFEPRVSFPWNLFTGYAGFIPCFSWIMGVNYLKGVKDAMNNFDRNQVMQWEH